MALTPRQKELLDFVARFIQEKGYNPSFKEIARGLQLSSLATVYKHIQALQQKHYVKKSYRRSRSVELTQKYFQELKKQAVPPRSLPVPLLGGAGASSGSSTTAGQQIDLAGLVQDPDTFALVVQGDSMIGEHIRDGDIVLVARNEPAADGDLAVVSVEGGPPGLRRIHAEPGEFIRLEAANPEVEPLRLPRERVQVLGRVIAVLRKY